MADNVATVTKIYEAFGRGDIPTILGHLREDVVWEKGADAHGVPWLEPGRGIDHATAFFGRVAENLGFKRFEPTGTAVGDGVVLTFVSADVLVTSTGKSFTEDIEVHGWWFDDEGKVAAFRHFVDTPKHIEAFTA